MQAEAQAVAPMGFAKENASCKANVLLDTTLTRLVFEKFPPSFMAYALIVFVPATSGNTAIKFVRALVLVARFQSFITGLWFFGLPANLQLPNP